MTIDALCKKMEVLKDLFDVVRLVDTSRNEIVVPEADGTLSRQEYRCFDIWGRGQRCDNCVSAKACATHGEVTKFEFRDDQVFFILAKYMPVDDVPYVLEAGKLVDDRALFSAYGKNEFIEKITSFNQKIYLDSLTGCYNRRYFDEQLPALEQIRAVAVLDIDYFKSINDSYGHAVGDAVLKAAAAVLMENVRSQDRVIRLGGDEFAIAFREMPKDALPAKLESLRQKLEAVEIPGDLGRHMTASFGGCYCEGFEESIFRTADQLLYEAKKNRNAIVVKN